jgi:hypothetical protein
MRKTSFQRARYTRLLLVVCISSINFGCNNESRQSGAPVPISRQINGQTEAKRESYQPENSRITSSNIKTH